jgi:hypothetical protein
MTADLVTKFRQLEWEVLVGELRGIERQRQRLEDLGIFDKTERATCWCGDPIIMTTYGWGHMLLNPYHHPASPTKPIRRQRKKKET